MEKGKRAKRAASSNQTVTEQSLIVKIRCLTVKVGSLIEMLLPEACRASVNSLPLIIALSRISHSYVSFSTPHSA
jgi:hypothetical protein